ncbi:hypothetical protein CBM2615_B60039 [Cupriavidus taiwanensis]|nr:hypothetical protein CBM2615_B60039 [Cupriavidus taiwanensis]
MNSVLDLEKDIYVHIELRMNVILYLKACRLSCLEIQNLVEEIIVLVIESNTFIIRAGLIAKALIF